MVSIWFEGIDEMNTVTADLEAAKGGVGAQGSKVLRRYALEVERLGKRNCPVDTGNLRSSITTSFEGDGRFGAMSAEVGPTAHYGGYVEWGTRYQAPQAYMGPALDRVGPKYVAACEQLANPFGGMSGRTGRG